MDVLFITSVAVVVADPPLSASCSSRLLAPPPPDGGRQRLLLQRERPRQQAFRPVAVLAGSLGMLRHGPDEAASKRTHLLGGDPIPARWIPHPYNTDGRHKGGRPIASQAQRRGPVVVPVRGPGRGEGPGAVGAAGLPMSLRPVPGWNHPWCPCRRSSKAVLPAPASRTCAAPWSRGAVNEREPTDK